MVNYLVQFLMKFVKLSFGDEQPITCRPADLIEPELEGYRQVFSSKGYNGITDEDVLTYAMFPEVAINFFDANRR